MGSCTGARIINQPVQYMPSYKHLNPLTKWQKNICEYGGLFGILISLTCLIQHMSVLIKTSITNSFIPCYLLAITAFSLLAAQIIFAPLLLIISGAYSIYIVYEWTRHQASSAIVWLFLIYHILILVGIYTERIPKRLAQKQRAIKEEKKLWDGKI